jgi:organic radical activating enzyme
MSTYCSLPWIHLATHPHGGATLCCVSDFTDSMNSARSFVDGRYRHLNLNKNSVVEIMNSDYFKQVRLQMLNDETPRACVRCYREEDNGVRSKRIEENEKLGFTEDMARAITQADGTIPVNFKFVELRLGNLCNVKCRTCNPASSTQWVTEYKKLQQELKFVTQYDAKINASWTESEEFWDDLLEHSKDVELLYINGGEPTLVEKHWHYLERLIERGLNKQITLWYNINMTNLPDNLIELWSYFKAVQVSCSIDDLGARNEYIRSGTKWEDVIANLDKLQSIPWINTSVCQTVSWMNVYYLPEFHEFMKGRGLHVHMNFVHDPAFLSVRALPAALTGEILLRCKGLDGWKIDMLINMFSGSEGGMALNQGMQFNAALDSSRHTSFAATFPEWSKLCRA